MSENFKNFEENEKKVQEYTVRDLERKRETKRMAERKR